MTQKTLAGAMALFVALGSTAAAAGDLERLARDLERVLGKGSVEVHRGTTAPLRRPAPQATAAAGGIRDAELVRAMNRQRAAHGLSPLQLDGRLSLAANDRLADMFHQRYFAHVAPDGTQPFVWVTRRGYPYRMVGENLAAGYGTAERVVAGWMQSPGHRRNILQRGFAEIGVAVAPGAPARGYGGPTIVAIYASR